MMKLWQAVRPRGARILTLALLFCGAWNGLETTGTAAAQTTERSVQGRVVTENDTPIRSAIVYLSDSRTMAVTSYITQEDGAYRFQQMSPNDDYKLWAQLDGKKSKTKVISSFDDRSVFHVILKVDTGK